MPFINSKASSEIILKSEQISLDLDEQTDRSLVARIAARDKRALRELFMRHQMRVCSLLRRIGCSRESVEDVVIETFVVVWREAHEFRGESRVLIWLFGLAYRLRFAYLRTEIASSEGAVETDFDGDSSEITRPDWLSRALVRLSFRQRAAIQFVHGLGLSCDETASVMQCSLKTVKARLLHARRHLDLSNLKTAASSGSISLRNSTIVDA